MQGGKLIKHPENEKQNKLNKIKQLFQGSSHPVKDKKKKVS